MNKSMLRRIVSLIVGLVLVLGSLSAQGAVAEEAQGQRFQLVLTLAADISSSQKSEILRYFGITEDQAKVITITHADEHAQLGNLLPSSVIGSKTLSCALIRLTTSGGIQVKTANMNYVTSNMIASTLSTSGVYNCEVLTAAPFSVSGTGALTGVMMAYEAGTGLQLDPEKKSLANEELVITGEISKSVGQDQATLVVNDIKIHIVRDGITDQQEVVQVVDDVIATTEMAAAQAASTQGKAAPAKLGTVETQQLYDFGYKFSQIGYNYSDMQPTLERVTRNITKSTGIEDPITDTFTTPDDDGLSIDSILLNTEDSVMGKDANINATNTVALGDHPAETIEVITGDVRLTEAGRIKAESFITGSNLIAFKDVNGLYALMDLNGNVLTDSIYTNDFRSRNGLITAKISDDANHSGILNTDGTILVPFQYDVVEVLGNLWGAGIYLVDGTDEDYDYYGFGGGRYQIGTVDLYYFGGDNSAPVASLSRDSYGEGYAVGDFLNVRDRNGSVITYDSSFQIVQYPNSLYDSSYDESYRAAEILSSQMKATVNRFVGNYGIIYKDGKSGVVDRYGNIIIPIEFERIGTSNDEIIVSGGYVAAQKDGRFVYVVQGGGITADYPAELYSMYNYGMASYIKDENSIYTLVSGDGIVTTLDSKYTYLSALDASKGLLWKAQLADYSYDLIDWHGNTLLSGSDDYSIAANGNYLIAQDGNTSSTLYMVNDASPVAIAESAGGASELTANIQEGASLEAYTGETSIELLGSTIASDFIDGTSLMVAQNEASSKWMILDINGRQLTEAKYTNSFELHYGWLVVQEQRDGNTYYGVLSLNGAQVIPCDFSYVDILNENWLVAYTFVADGSEEDYDFRDWYNEVYYHIETAVVCHLTETEVSSVSLTRDQIQDIAACEDYINVQDRTTGTVTTYDSSFSAVATVNYIHSFTGFSAMEVLRKTIEDKTGYSIYDESFPDGYSRVSDWRSEVTKMGVVNMNGDIVVPVEYDRIQTTYGTTSHIWANGYFCVENDGLFGYVTEGGNVSCSINNPTDYYDNAGMAASVKISDNNYSLVAADGIVTEGYSRLGNLYGGMGLLWRTESSTGDGYDLIDWHGNVLLANVYDIEVSGDGNYVLIQKDWRDAYELYGINGARLDGEFAESKAETPSETASADNNIDMPSTTDTVDTEEDTGVVEVEQEESVEEEQLPDEQGMPAEQVPEDEEPTGEVDISSAKALLTSAESLITVDITGNHDAIMTLVDQAKSILEKQRPNEATVINSVITLLGTENPDAGAITTLIDTVLSMLE